MRANLSLLAGLAVMVGCSESGPQRAEVSGSVSIDGKPVESGSISFIPDKGNKGPSAGGPIENGKYRIPRDKGPVVGINQVQLSATRKTGKKIQDPTAKPGVLTDELVEAFPPEYNKSPGVHREIKSGPNVVDFDVKARK